MENPAVKPNCQQAPENPVDGQKFTCPGCGYTSTWVILDDPNHKGEWV